MNKVTRILGWVLPAVLASGLASAQDKKSDKGEKASYKPKWGMAGCGLWSDIVIKDHGRWSQLGAWALRNMVFYDFQTSAMTSGTSDCVDGAGTVAQQEAEQRTFVAVNLEALQRQAAAGQGDHLFALSELLGCERHEAVAELSHQKFGVIFGQTEPDAVLESLKAEIRSQQASVGTCKRVG